MLNNTGIALMAGFLLDLAIGDPRWLYHPVRLIGKVIDLLEKIFRKILPKTPRGELAGGAMLGHRYVGGDRDGKPLDFCIWHISCIPASVSRWKLSVLSDACGSFSERRKHAGVRCTDLRQAGAFGYGRAAVSRIVGRDTDNLDETGVTKAAVETVAENFGDGVFAPMLYMALGGPVCMYLYKAINTMDSMLGYKNERFLYFGRCAAKLDDIANFIPARLAGLTLVLSAYLGPFDGKNAARIFFRDRRKHASPNSAHTEAAAAGALDIQLAGNAYYFGKLYEKPFIGDPLQAVRPDDIRRVNRLMYLGAFLSALLLGGISFFLYGGGAL